MKEITRINLATLPYNVEVEAKKQLEKYLTAVEHSLGADADAMREIEARISELLAERGVVDEKVITGEDVAAIQEQLGEAKDFAGEGAEEYDLPDAESLREKPVRRLMRDRQHATLGGVCAGIAAYFNVDVTLVRVVAVALTFLSMGVMVPLYLLMWLIIPAAKTTADRLQMAGEAVTLKAITEHAAAPTNTAEPALATFLRYGLAGCLLVGALAIFIAMAFITYQQAPAVFAQPPAVIALVITVAMAGVFLILLLCLLAYALIVKKFTHKMGVVLLAIMLAGLGCFMGGAFGLSRISGPTQQPHQVTKNVSMAALAGAKQLVITSAGNVALNYQVAALDTRGELSYADVYKPQDIPEVTLTKNGDIAALTIKGGKTRDCAYGCDVWLNMQGPAFERVVVNNGRLVYMEDMPRSTPLAVEAHNNAKVVITGEKQIDQATFTATDSSDIDATGSALAQVNASLSQTGSLQLSNVVSLELTGPASCPGWQYSQPVVNYASAGTVKLNGQPASPDQPTPCVKLVKTIN